MENVIAKNRNSGAQMKEERAQMVIEVANEMGSEWSDEAFGEDDRAGRYKALIAMHDYAQDLLKRALEDRKRAFLEVTE